MIDSQASSEYLFENLYSVKGTTVLITGGGTGLGKAIATAFAVNGAKVILAGRRQSVLEIAARDIGTNVTFVVGDVSTKDGAKAILVQVATVTDKLDTLINSAGISIPFKRPTNNVDDPSTVYDLLSQVDDVDWTKTNNVNVNGPFFMTTAAIPLLQKSGNPSVVIISSVAGLANQRANGSFTYGVSKAAAVHLSSMLAGRLHPLKIRVNCICPGIFPTEMTGARSSSGDVELGEMGSKASLRCTLERAGKGTEIAAPVLMLASRGGMYHNDTCINVDGGRWLVMKGIYDGLRLREDSYIA